MMCGGSSKKKSRRQANVNARVVGEGPQSQAGKMEKSAFGRTRHGEKIGPPWLGFGVCAGRVLGLCSVLSGDETDVLVQAR